MDEKSKKIVNALLFCNKQNDCEKCEYGQVEGDCVELMEFDAVSVIIELNNKIDKLRRERDETISTLNEVRYAAECDLRKAHNCYTCVNCDGTETTCQDGEMCHGYHWRGVCDGNKRKS